MAKPAHPVIPKRTTLGICRLVLGSPVTCPWWHGETCVTPSIGSGGTGPGNSQLPRGLSHPRCRGAAYDREVAGAPTGLAVDVAAAIDEAERRARDAVPELTLVMYLEPDVDLGDAHVPADRPEPLAH